MHLELSKIKEHIGGIYEFLQKRKLESLKELEKKSREQYEKDTDSNSTKKLKYEDKKEYERNLRKSENKLKHVESQIEKLEAQLNDIGTKLADPQNIKDHDLFEKYGETEKQIELKMKEWEKLNIELERVRKKGDFK